MKDTFEVWCNRAFDYEGRVYENVPGDRGGPTKWGITIGRVATIKGVKLPKPGTAAYNRLVENLKALTPDEIKAIYKRDYWDAVRGDDLPPGVDFAVADFGLNSGPSRAAKYLCRCLGKKQSGTLNNEVIQAAREADPDDLVNAYCDARAAFLNQIAVGSQDKFRKGWLNRVRDVRTRSLKLIVMKPAEPPPVEMKPDVAMPKADPPKPTTKELTKVSRKAVWLVWINRVLKGIATLFTLDTVLSALNVAQDVIGKVKGIVSEEANVIIISAAILGSMAIAYVISLMRVDVEEGRLVPSGEVDPEPDAA
jgi:lysozyme family protein